MRPPVEYHCPCCWRRSTNLNHLLHGAMLFLSPHCVATHLSNMGYTRSLLTAAELPTASCTWGQWAEGKGSSSPAATVEGADSAENLHHRLWHPPLLRRSPWSLSPCAPCWRCTRTTVLNVRSTLVAKSYGYVGVHNSKAMAQHPCDAASASFVAVRLPHLCQCVLQLCLQLLRRLQPLLQVSLGAGGMVVSGTTQGRARSPARPFCRSAARAMHGHSTCARSEAWWLPASRSSAAAARHHTPVNKLPTPQS